MTAVAYFDHLKFFQNITCEWHPILNQREKMGVLPHPVKIFTSLSNCIVKEVEEGDGDWCDPDYDGNVDGSQTIASAGRGVEVEVRRVGERIGQVLHFVVRSVWRSPDQWELTEGQESHNLAAETTYLWKKQKVAVLYEKQPHNNNCFVSWYFVVFAEDIQGVSKKRIF